MSNQRGWPNRRLFLLVAIGIPLVFATIGERPVLTQSPARVDFARDVQPILQKNCVGCHGPSQQMAGYRLDRRSTAYSSTARRVVIPGSSDSSRLYRRIIGPDFGTQMPPTGALASQNIDTLKRWIDEGAEWPDALANEAPPPPIDPAAVRLSDAIRAGDMAAVDQALAQDARRINARGRAGSTPLMYAALYGDAGLLERMLKAGGDPNIGNDVGATALMWAVDDLAKTRLLLDRGAEPNARSNYDRTALSLAAGQAGSEAVVRLLLERGAAVVPGALTNAANRGNLELVRVFLKAGARDNGDAAIAALRANCFDCIDAIKSAQPLPLLRAALVTLFPPGTVSPDAVRAALALGADVNAKDAQSRTVLMKAALADQMPPEIVHLLIERGADVKATMPDGQTALDFARLVGNVTVIDALVKAGATSTNDAAAPVNFVRGNSRAAAVRRSLPLLQRAAVEFYRKSGCVSCHSNALTAMTVAAARARKFPVDEPLAKQELDTVLDDAANAHDSLLQGLVKFGGGPPTIGYVLMGLAAGKHPRDLSTDAMVRLLRLSQLPDGRWRGAYRPPHESSEFTYTAVNLKGLVDYSSGSCDECAFAVRRAATWLATSQPRNTEDRVFRLFGLKWAQASDAVVRSVADDLRRHAAKRRRLGSAPVAAE